MVSSNYGILVLVLPVLTVASSYYGMYGQNCGSIEKSKGAIIIEQVTLPVKHGEAPHWDNGTQKLYFVDVHGPTINRFDPETGGVTTAYIPHGDVGHLVPVKNCKNQFVVGVGLDFTLITWDSDNNDTNPSMAILASVGAGTHNGTHINDGKVDSKGRLWAGTIGNRDETGVLNPNQGSLYQLKSDLIPVTEISPVNNSNGLAWNSMDDTFYYIDSPTRKIAAYDFDADQGTISNRRYAFDFDSFDIPGMPNGMTIDNNNNLWIAAYGAGKVLNVDPRKGTLIQSIEFPVTYVTSVTFGGSSLDILYVTSVMDILTKEQHEAEPKAGSVFAVKGLGVSGSVANSFLLHAE